MSIPFLVSMLLLWIYTTEVYSDENREMSCRPFYGRLSDLKLQQPPKRVLLVPLLSRDPYTNESSRWSEQPARTLEAFYRNRFNATVSQLQDVWSWKDFYRQVEKIVRQQPLFDRVIFIGHGGFDGPILNTAEYWHYFEVTGNKGKLVQFSETQPGLKNVWSITYDTEKNRIFSEYMASHRPELALMKFSDIWHLLTALEKQLLPLDQTCFQRKCPPHPLAARPKQQVEYQLYLCDLLCRESLFKIKTSEEISPDRLFHFTNSLNSLVTEDGLIFFGSCNPGSAAPKKVVQRDKIGLLINSTLAGGPYKSYVHLVSAATGRISAGPIGQSSAGDIVNRIIMFETGLPQHNLCVATPAAK